jgi:membrane protein required for colicin V production
MIIDILFLVIAGYGFYTGYQDGILKTLFKVVSIMFGFLIALKFTTVTTKFLQGAMNSTNPLLFPLGFIITFLIIMYLIRYLATLMTKVLEAAKINIINQIAGGALMALMFTIVYSVILWFCVYTKMLGPNTTAESKTYSFLEPMPQKAKSVINIFIPILKDFWNDATNTINGGTSTEEPKQN